MKRWPGFRNLSLRTRLLVILALVGFVPLFLTFSVYYREISRATLNSQSYAANQNYEQTLSALSGKLSRIEKLSTMIIVNDVLVEALGVDPDQTDIGEQVIGFERINTYTRVLEESSESDSIFYYIDDRFVVSGTDTRFRKLRYVEGKAWAEAVLAGRGEPTWFYYRETTEADSPAYLALGRILWNIRDFSDSMGIVVINLELGAIEDTLTKTAPEQIVYLENEQGELIASSEQGKSFPRLPAVVETGSRFEEVRLEQMDYLYRSSPIGKSGIRLTTLFPKAAFSQAVNTVTAQTTLLYVLVAAVLLILIFPVTRSITARVFLLTRKMEQVRKGDLRQLDIEPREDEVGQLVSSYNFMINSVEELLQEQYRLGQEKKEAELKALQSQINPHFLYNTLDMLNWMAYREERGNIQQVVYALSDYYKLILNKGEDFVTLQDELRLCRIYVEIQQKRFRDRIAFSIQAEEEMLDCLLPKITLQPLVENAIIHGITEKPDGRGNVAITAVSRGGRLRVTVEDDGIGFTNEWNERPGYRGSGYGVMNIEKRLELYFGEQGVLRFESSPAAGTRVILDIPATRRLADEA